MQDQSFELDPTWGESRAPPPRLAPQVVVGEEVVEELDATAHAEDKPDDEAIGVQRCFDRVFIRGFDDVNAEGFENGKEDLKKIKKSKNKKRERPERTLVSRYIDAWAARPPRARAPPTCLFALTLLAQLCAKAQSTSLQDNFNRIPEGLTPMVAWKWCPPGGVYMQLGHLLVDPLNDAYQAVIFFQHKDVWFGVLVTATVVFTMIMQAAVWKLSEGAAPWSEAQRCVARGIATEAWKGIFMVELGVEGIVSGLIAPYGLIRITSLSMVGALSGIYGFYSSVKAFSSELIACDCFLSQDPRGSTRLGFTMAVEGSTAVMSTKYPLRHYASVGYRWLQASAELSVFALACFILHPVLLFPFYLLNNLCGNWLMNLFTPAQYFGAGASLHGIREGKYPVLRPVVMTLVRITALLLGCVMLNLHNGVLNLGTLSRQMGGEVWHRQLLIPTQVTAEAAHACFILLTRDHSVSNCALPVVHGLSNSSAVYRACMTMVALICVPLYMGFTLALIIFHRSYREETIDEALMDEIWAKQEEIHEWAEARQRAFTEAGILSTTGCE